MGRLQLAVGTRYERDGRTFVVLQVLRDGRLVVEDQSGGGQGVVTRDEVTAAWERGALRFAVRGPGARVGKEGEGTLPTGYTIADVHLLPERERAEAWRRYTLIRPLLTWPAGARTRRAIEEYLSTLSGARAPTGTAGRRTSGRAVAAIYAVGALPPQSRCTRGAGSRAGKSAPRRQETAMPRKA